MTTADLIRRARELSRFRRRVVEGPYSFRPKTTKSAEPPVILANDGVFPIATVEPYITPGAHFLCNRNAQFLASSWEMAELLEKFADTLERQDDRLIELCPECGEDGMIERDVQDPDIGSVAARWECDHGVDQI